jgi:hypothetical protein
MISRDSPFFYLAEELLPVVLPLGFDGEDACAGPVLRGCQAALKHLPESQYTDKKEKKISSYVRKFRPVAKSYMRGRAS